MSSCLGLYIENNLIKYAKITRERENLKVDVFGIKFYENLDEAINQIISETSSENIPISINLQDEVYNFFDVSNSLSKNELKEEVEKKFEDYCTRKKISSIDYESRYLLEKDNTKVLHVSSEKSKINHTLKQNIKVSSIVPIGTSITNIMESDEYENILIVNMDEETIVTSIVNREINDITKIKQGQSNILKKIAGKENSYSKAYEICRNSTIYTIDGGDSSDDENEYMNCIIPTLYKIVTEIQKYISKSESKYSKIYITGTLSVINNVDLYFQEFFPHAKCEILKPYFIKEITKVNIKDYVEVNSALAIAMEGVGYGNLELNFKKQGFSVSMPRLRKKENKKEQTTKEKKPIKLSFDFNLTGSLDKTEKILLRVAAFILTFTIVFILFSLYLNYSIEKKTEQAEELEAYTDVQISLAEEDIDILNDKADRYQDLVDNLTGSSDDEINLKNAIPNLLSDLQLIIPEHVQLTEIENTVENNNRHIIIIAQSEYYDELGYFKVKLKEEGILTNVVSSQENTEDGFVQMIIEGDLL